MTKNVRVSFQNELTSVDAFNHCACAICLPVVSFIWWSILLPAKSVLLHCSSVFLLSSQGLQLSSESRYIYMATRVVLYTLLKCNPSFHCFQRLLVRPAGEGRRRHGGSTVVGAFLQVQLPFSGSLHLPQSQFPIWVLYVPVVALKLEDPTFPAPGPLTKLRTSQ